MIVNAFKNKPFREETDKDFLPDILQVGAFHCKLILYTWGSAQLVGRRL